MNEITFELFHRWDMDVADLAEAARAVGLVSERQEGADLEAGKEMGQSITLDNEKARAAGQK